MRYKSKSLINEAIQVKRFMEKNKKIPKTATLDGSIISSYSLSFLFAKFLQDLQQNDVDLINIRCYDGKKIKDVVDEKIIEKDYLLMIKRFVNFCQKYHRVPRFITSPKGVKVSFEVFLYCLSKIIVYYKEKGTLPNYCHFNKTFTADNKSNTQKDKNSHTSSICSNPYKSIGHPTKTGCNEMGQNTSYYCGVSALHKILRKFKITKYDQKTLAAFAGTTTKGTSPSGLETAVAKVSKETGIKLTAKWYYFSDLGWEKLAKMICNEDTDAIIHLRYRMNYGHYEVLNEIDLQKKQVKVLNSLGNKCGSSCYCGYVETRSFALEKNYIDAMSQKSILIVKKG